MGRKVQEEHKLRKARSFVVYADDIKEQLDCMSDEEAGELFKAMVTYKLTKVEPALEGILKFVFIPIRQQMDRDEVKYLERCENNARNREKANNERRPSSTIVNERQPSSTYNENDDDDDENDDENDDDGSLSRSALEHLNKRTGAKYKPEGKALELLETLFGSGYTKEQVDRVIDRKCDEWLEVPHMRCQLTPSVLFKPDRFEEYLQAAPTEEELRRGLAERRKKNDESRRESLGQKLEAVRMEYESETDRGKRVELRNRIRDIEAMLA